ncbi:S8 family serine peptidase, partial [Candidatus Woesearchaeota archaeon]|nr:S8 family serine peptidase [Candidatus Woesearchaeota archaeon]
MKKAFIWIIAVILLAGIIYFSSGFSLDSITGHSIGAVPTGVDSEVEEQIINKGTAEVIVKLKDKPIDSAIISGNIEGKKKHLEEQKEMVKKVQKEVLKKLDVQKKGETFAPKKILFGLLGTKEEPDIKLEYEYGTVNAISGNITEDGLKKLRKNKDVEYIQIIRPVEAFLDNSISQITADDTWSLVYNGTNLTGRGQAICVLDTGIDYTHSALGNCTTAGFLAGNCSKVIAGYDVYNDDADPQDDHSHGTHCAGIAASNNAVYRGVAPDANLVALKVLDSGGNGNTQTIIAGIDWCINNSLKYNISVISMSLGVRYDYNQDYCDDDFPAERDAINSAVGSGIFIAIASGNDGPYGSGISAPSCIFNATPVGGVNPSDSGLEFQRGSLLNLIAPSNSITSTVLNNGFADKSGTSMATPHAAGAAALLQQYKQITENTSFTPQELEDLFDNTGRQIYDSATSKNYSRIDVFSAVISQDSISPVINISYPENNTAFNSSASINITSSEELSSALLEWEGTNESMSGSRVTWHKLKYGHGIYLYRIWGNDSAGNLGVSETRIVSITSFSPNITSVYPLETVNIIEPENQNFNLSAHDPENSDLNISWHINGSLQLSGINQTEWNFTGNYSTAGIYNITAVVSDGYSTDSNEWILIVNNTPFVSGSVIPNQTGGKTTNRTINLSLYFNSPDNENLSFISTNPENISVYIDNETDTAILEPSVDFTGIRYIVFTAFDIYMANASSNNITINITGNNIPEVHGVEIICSDSYNKTEGNLKGSFVYYDKDNDNQSMNETKWYNYSAEAVLLRNLTLIDSESTSKNQTWIFSARTYDGYGWSDWVNSSGLEIQNSGPVLDAIPGQSATEGDIVTITASASDADADGLVYYINDSRFSKSENIFTWETNSTDSGIHYLTVNVTDNESWDVQDNIKLNISEQNNEDSSSGSSGGGSGGGGGGGSVKKPPAVVLTANRKDSHTFNLLPQGSTEKGIDKTELAFTGYTFNTNKILSSVTITTEALLLRPTGIPSPAESVYQYVSVDINQDIDENLDSADIRFKIDENWMTNFDENSVRLNRYTTEWTELETELIEHADGYYYSAVSPGFSYFAITAKPKIETVYEAFAEPEPAEEPLIEEDLISGVVTKEAEEKNSFFTWKTGLYVLIGTGILAGLIILRFV